MGQGWWGAGIVEGFKEAVQQILVRIYSFWRCVGGGDWRWCLLGLLGRLCSLKLCNGLPSIKTLQHLAAALCATTAHHRRESVCLDLQLILN